MSTAVGFVAVGTSGQDADNTAADVLPSSSVAGSAPRGPAHAVPIAQAGPALELAQLPGCDLDSGELARLVATIAADESSWRGEVAFPEHERHYVSLHRDEHVDVWLLCWSPVNDTGWHDHDLSSGAVAVVQGELVEHNLLIGRPSTATPVPAGRVYGFGPEHIHRLCGLAQGSVSIHAYSPPLRRLGQYSIDEYGVLRRVSVSYLEELRPIPVPA